MTKIFVSFVLCLGFANWVRAESCLPRAIDKLPGAAPGRISATREGRMLEALEDGTFSDLKISLRKSEFSQAQLAVVAKNAHSVLTVDDYLHLKDVKEGYALGLSKDVFTYQPLADVHGLKTWLPAYNELGMKIRETGHTEKFLEQITGSGKPVVMFVPNQTFTHGKGHVTRDEMNWLLAHPDKLKNVRFVFGAYDFVSEGARRKFAALGADPIEQQAAIREFLIIRKARKLNRLAPGGPDASDLKVDKFDSGLGLDVDWVFNERKFPPLEESAAFSGLSFKTLEQLKQQAQRVETAEDFLKSDRSKPAMAFGGLNSDVLSVLAKDHRLSLIKSDDANAINGIRDATAGKNPVVFFVPGDLYDPSASAAQAQLGWLMSNPSHLKNVALVFGVDSLVDAKMANAIKGADLSGTARAALLSKYFKYLASKAGG